MSQNDGAKFACITQEGVAVVCKEGKLVTAWGSDNFDDSMNIIVKNYMESRLFMYKKLEKIINDWDPAELFPMAPKDEYKKEISDILSICENNSDISEVELSKLIKIVLENSFGKEMIFKNDELEIAKKIKKLIYQ